MSRDTLADSDPGAGAAPAIDRHHERGFAAALAVCCTALRVGREAEAAARLDTLLGRLGAWLTERPERATPSLQGALARALDSQRRGDPIALADELEHVLAPLLLGERTSAP